MSARRERDVAEPSGASGEGDSGLMIAESTRVPDLPGVIVKKVILGPDEIGFVTSGGNVVSQLSSGPNKVGWSFLAILHHETKIINE